MQVKQKAPMLTLSPSPYPYFPKQSEDGYSQFMQRSLRIAESWTCTQGFFWKYFYIIPEALNFVQFNEDEEKCVIPLVELLINIAGPNIKQKINGR